MRSPVVDRILKKMEMDPWHVKLKRWYRLQIWVLICRTRKFWDLTYKNNIFKRK